VVKDRLPSSSAVLLIKSRFLGINSPSKVFSGIGENMALGLGKGFETEMNKVPSR
jgi:hypothetical protein